MKILHMSCRGNALCGQPGFVYTTEKKEHVDCARCKQTLERAKASKNTKY